MTHPDKWTRLARFGAGVIWAGVVVAFVLWRGW